MRRRTFISIFVLIVYFTLLIWFYNKNYYLSTGILNLTTIIIMLLLIIVDIKSKKFRDWMNKNLW